MSDDSPDGLVHGTMGLLSIPVLTRYVLYPSTLAVLIRVAQLLLPFVEIVLLEDDLWRFEKWEGDANYNDASSFPILEIETLAESTAAHTHQDGTCSASTSLVDIAVKPFDHAFILANISLLFVDSFTRLLFHLEKFTFLISPDISTLLCDCIGRKEYKDSTYSHLCNLCDCKSEFDKHVHIASPLVIEHKFHATLSLSDHLDGDLFLGDDVLVGQVNWEVNLEFCPESVQRGQGS